ncbi:MAG TPA: metal ABC transporter permease [Actinomycetota bacterium]|nr:metal ABC transporter permease [Actinomycetota bacterium]
MSRLLAEWVVRAYLAGAVVGVTAPVIGSFLVQRRLALIGDGMGHLAFAGVALGVVLGASPLWGALVVAAAGALLLEGLRSRGRLAGDVSLAIVFYVGIALGSVLLSAAGRFDASLLGVLFGSILTATWADVAQVAGLCALILATTAVSYRGLLAVALDEETARASGLPVEGLNLLLLGLVALLVAAGMRVVGLLLVASLLVIPVAAGSRLAHSFRGALLWGSAAGLASVLLGLVAAVWQGEVAPGGAIVLASAAVFAAASAVGRRAARRHPRRALP